MVASLFVIATQTGRIYDRRQTPSQSLPFGFAQGKPLPLSPLGDAHIIPLWDADRDAVKALYTRLTTLAPGASAGEDGVDRYAWLDKEKPCGEPRRTILPGQSFDTASLVNLPDWELEICKAVL